MPQISEGGKFVFGYSLVREGFIIQLPPQAVEEYNMAVEEKVFLFTGSKTTGGFGITRQGLLLTAKPGDILKDIPELLNYELPEGGFIPYKGRSYCWVEISTSGMITLPIQTASFLQIESGMKLLSIRGSNIALVMGAKGPLIKKAEDYNGDINIF